MLTTYSTIVLYEEDLIKILEQMKKNREQEPSMSNCALFVTKSDSDLRSYVIDKSKEGNQFSGYAECNGMSIRLK